MKTSEQQSKVNPPLPLHEVLADEYYAIDGNPTGRVELQERIDALPTVPEKLAIVINELHNEPRLALCFSGGGIRSATFNLGILQGLAVAGLLEKFQYLSTVSGGGYIGSWLTAWIHHKNGDIGDVQRNLADAARRDIPNTDKLHPEPSAIDHLREYSNYLSPKMGFLSADTWTMVGAYVRNLLLNWLVIVPLLAAALALPRVGVIVSAKTGAHPCWKAILLVLGGGFLVGALSYIATSLPSINGTRSKLRCEGPFLRCCLIPLLLAAGCLTTFWVVCRNQVNVNEPPATDWWFSYWALLAVCLFGAGAHLAAMLWHILRAGLPKKKKGGIDLVTLRFDCSMVIAAGAAGGLLLWWVATRIFPRPGHDPALYACFAAPMFMGIFLLAMFLYIGCVGKITTDEDREWWARASGWVMISCVVWLGASVLVIYGPCVFEVSWPALGVSGAGIASGVISALLGASGKTSASDSKDTEKKASKGLMGSLMDKAPVLAAPVFLMCLAIVISFGTTKLVTRVGETSWFHPSVSQSASGESGGKTVVWEKAGLPAQVQVTVLQKTGEAKKEDDKAEVHVTFPLKDKKEGWIPVGGFKHPVVLSESSFRVTLLVAIVLGGIGVIAGLFINANVFSMHAMYRDRLIRAYLGASRVNRRDAGAGDGPGDGDHGRWPNCFTGFDEEDNIPMWKLWLPDEAARRRRMLFPVINCTLNLVAGKKLAWQDRKAESFTVTPLHCGSFHIGAGTSEETRGYRLNNPKPDEGGASGKLGDNESMKAEKREQRYGGKRGITLGTAVAISGAAASPNWGYHSSPLVTLIMTFFNVRLGWWLGNPGSEGRNTYDRRYPMWAPKPILDEALGRTDDTNPYIYLSDGGHFENLGVYEMVLRRCHVIVACDAGQDGDFTFEDLGNLVRKVRIDFGIPIEFGESPLFDCNGKSKRPKDGKARCAIANIRYSAVDKGRPDGVLIYIKPVVYGHEEPRDVVQYWRTCPEFPHETTLDQFFSESQFESYRALGLCTIAKMFGVNGWASVVKGETPSWRQIIKDHFSREKVTAPEWLNSIVKDDPAESAEAAPAGTAESDKKERAAKPGKRKKPGEG